MYFHNIYYINLTSLHQLLSLNIFFRTTSRRLLKCIYFTWITINNTSTLLKLIYLHYFTWTILLTSYPLNMFSLNYFDKIT